ncbi:MAG TPA: hypothetical protein VJG65_03020 [Patescibacteria group bacterium]|nr:hypothetical protein [Patescibacteria group bacterium]
MYLLAPAFTFAQVEPDRTGLEDFLNRAGTNAGYDVGVGNAETGLASLAGRIAQIFISLIGIIFISYTIYGGYLWLTAAGNQEKIKKANDIIRWGIVGLIVILAAAAIYLTLTNFLIGNRSGGTGVPYAG